MIHEVLTALLGYPGGVFVPSPSILPTTFAIDATVLPLLHPAEVQQLEELAQIGFYVYDIRHRCKSVRRHKDAPYYLRSACLGVDKAIDEWHVLVLEIEQDYKVGTSTHPMQTLTGLSSRLQTWPSLMRSLHDYMVEITDPINQASATTIFNLTHTLYERGLPSVQPTYCTILRHILQPFARQTIYWMLYATLQDPHREYFIREEEKKKDATSTHWTSRHTLVQKAIPKCLSLETAEKILFVGKAMATLALKEEHADVPDRFRESCLLILKEAFDHVEDLAQSIEDAVKRVHTMMGKFLWREVVHQSHLEKKLHVFYFFCLWLKREKAFRRIHLQEEGDFFSLLAAKCVRYKCTLRQRVHNGDIMSMWQRCIALAAGEDEPSSERSEHKTLFDQYQFRLSSRPATDGPNEAYLRFPTGDRTMLQYTLPWPLHWIVTERDQTESPFLLVLYIKSID